MDRFEEIMETVLKWEGGYVNNPHDNGGPTNFGITHKVLADWRGLAGVSPSDVRDMTRQEAIAIFKDRYWKKIRGEALPPPIDFVVMDGAVNHGPQNIARMLQEAVGSSADGAIGPATIAAVLAKANSQEQSVDVAVKVAEARKTRYLGHEDAAHFINGWRNRLNDVMAVALRPYGISWSFKDGKTAGVGQLSIDLPPVSSIPQSAIEDTDLQAALATMGLYHGDIDGLFGPKSAAALDGLLARKTSVISGDWQSWSLPRRKLALGQLICQDLGIDVGRIDGLFGPQTQFAFEEFNRRKIGLPPDGWRDEIDSIEPPDTAAAVTTWPREKDVPAFYGSLGTDCKSVPLKKLKLPFKMKLSWDLNKKIDGFMVHEKVHDSAARVFDKIYAHYGDSGIEDIGVNLYGGCSSCRKKKGGSSWSMHAWSIAIDFDPARNQLSWNHTRARLAKADAIKFWEFWEAEGWLSLGRARDFDWMHVQAARL